MQKAKTFDIEDSNIALLGSQADKDARKKASESEPAWQVKHPETGKKVGESVGMFIWRIEKFKVKEWPREEYGNFFKGDSYIILVSVPKLDEEGKPTDKLAHDIFFWIGSESSQDEYGTCAYKTVELDDYINYHTGSDPVQHREVEGSESPAFMALFPKGVSFLSGGVESGFRHVEPTTYKTRFLHIKGKKNCVIREVELSVKSMNKGDIFIIDAGMEIYEWIGSKAGIMEKQKAAEVVRKLDDERGSKPTITVFDEKSSPPTKKFWDLLGGKAEVAKEIPDEPPNTSPKKMFRVSDNSGKLEMTKCDGFGSSFLDTNDVFVCDFGNEIFVWVGNGASAAEKANGMAYATQYLADNKRPKRFPITVVKEGAYSPSFEKTMA